MVVGRKGDGGGFFLFKHTRVLKLICTTFSNKMVLFKKKKILLTKNLQPAVHKGNLEDIWKNKNFFFNISEET